MRCKAGDLAMVIKSLMGKNDGKIVTVTEYISLFHAGEYFEYHGQLLKLPITDHYWWVWCPAGLYTPAGETQKAYIPDTWLRPIRPDLLPADEETGSDIYNILAVTN